MASVFKRDGKGAYLVAWFDQYGKRREKSARTTDYKVAERIAAKLSGDVALRREGLIDPKADGYALAERKPLTEHVDDFRTALASRGGTAKHIAMTVSQVARILELSNIDRIGKLSLSSVQSVLKTLQDQGTALRTCDSYVRAVKAFSRWLYRDGRASAYALKHLAGFNSSHDRRHERRALDDDELSALWSVADSGPTVLGITGPDRAICSHPRPRPFGGAGRPTQHRRQAPAQVRRCGCHRNP